MRHILLFAALLLSTFALGCQADEGEAEDTQEESSTGDSEDSEGSEEGFRDWISPSKNFQVGGAGNTQKDYYFWVDGSSDEVHVNLCYTQGFGKVTKVELFLDTFGNDPTYGFFYYNNANANCVSHMWWTDEPGAQHYIRIKKNVIDGSWVSGTFTVSTN